MKKLVLAASVALISTGAFAQHNTTNQGYVSPALNAPVASGFGDFNFGLDRLPTASVNSGSTQSMSGDNNADAVGNYSDNVDQRDLRR